MLNKDEIINILKDTNVLQEGHFILTSGRHSNQYMQMANVLQYAHLTERLIQNLAEQFKDEKIDVVVSPAIGGIIVGYELSRALGVRNIFCERENGEMKLRRGFTIKPNERVVVIEDVITTGGSVKEVIKVIEENGGNIRGIATLIDRSNGQVSFNYPYKSLLSLEIISNASSECPLCKEGTLPAIKPGSRKL